MKLHSFSRIAYLLMNEKMMGIILLLNQTLIQLDIFLKALVLLKHFSVRFQSIFRRHRISHPFLFILNAIPETNWITLQSKH